MLLTYTKTVDAIDLNELDLDVSFSCRSLVTAMLVISTSGVAINWHTPVTRKG